MAEQIGPRKNRGAILSTAPENGFVVFDRVQKSYDGETLVVKDLNLSIGKGEFLTMLGPSGSGKTTCLTYFHIRSFELAVLP